MSNLFQRAAKAKLRFHLNGSIAAEDLYDVSMAQLDAFAVKLDEKIAKTVGTYITKAKFVDTELKLTRDIVVAVLEDRMDMANRAELAAEKREKKAKLVDALDRKRNRDFDEAIDNMSEEELVAKINE